ncbi:hypothetical protein FRC10_007487 [Ceratobasidium sp. 414]|nr:hypothetical protein FRC10_007487 [Ceratobasidium sp. 414]
MSGACADESSPGYMLTSLTRTILEKNEDLKVSAECLRKYGLDIGDRQNTWVSLTPMGRMGEPEDLKGAIVYLASDASAFTNGTELRVDGAYTCI